MHLITFHHSVSLFIPSTVHDNQKADPSLIQDVLAMVASKMIDLFGGATITDAVGGFRLSNGKVVTEPIKIVKSAARELRKDKMIQLATDVGERMTQESVAIELDGEMILVAV